MSGTFALVGHSLRRSRGLLAAMTAVLAGTQVLFVLAAGALEEAGTFASVAALVPPFIRQAFGDSLFGFMSFAGLIAFGYFHPMIVAALAGLVIALATEPAADLETRFLDVVLARPVPRAVVIARSAILVACVPAALLAGMLAASTLGLAWLAPPGAPTVPRGLLPSLAVNLWATLFCIGGVSLVVASASRRRSVASATCGLAMLALFLVDYLSRVWPPAASLAPVSPFHYFDAMALVTGRSLPLGHVAVLAGAGAAGVALAFLLFARRDL
jgi:ABC-type transport system involved in multi-copper enzyme maturation permease subunit